MKTIERLIKGLTDRTTKYLNNSIEKDLHFSDEKADYENRIAELESALEKALEDLKVEREAFIMMDSQYKKVLEDLKVANEQIEDLKGIVKKLQTDKYGHRSEQQKYLQENNDQKETNSETQDDSDVTSEEENLREIKTGIDEVGEKRKKGGQKGHKGHRPKDTKTNKD